MRRVTLLALGVLIAGVAVASSGAATHAQSHWLIRDLGALGGKESAATAINERGQVIGWWDPGTGTAHAFIWQSGKMRNLGSLGGAYVEANDINNRGQVVGVSDTDRRALTHHAFLWEQGKMRDLGTLGGEESRAYAINDRGQVAGTADTKSGAQHVFLWQKGKLRDITPHFRSRVSIRVLGINAHGMVVLSDDKGRGYVWENGVLRDLGSLGGGATTPLALNDSGQVVGAGTTKSGSEHAFLWQKGKMTDLGVPPGEDWSRATAINERGQIIGMTGRTRSGTVFGRVWLWQRGKTADLRLSEANAADITDSGRILANTGDEPDPYSSGQGWWKAYAWEGRSWTQLPHLRGRASAFTGAVSMWSMHPLSPKAVNNRDQIVGWSGPHGYNGGKIHAVLWTLKRG